MDRVADEIRRAKVRFHLSEDVSGELYEAGREGLWRHRYLVATAWWNHVVDSSSIEVNRRARRAKTTDSILAGLLSLLERYIQGEQRVWHIVRVPSLRRKTRANLHRLRETIQQERTRLINRLQGCDHARRQCAFTRRLLGPPGGCPTLRRHASAGWLLRASRPRVGAFGLSECATR